MRKSQIRNAPSRSRDLSVVFRSHREAIGTDDATEIATTRASRRVIDGDGDQNGLFVAALSHLTMIESTDSMQHLHQNIDLDEEDNVKRRMLESTQEIGFGALNESIETDKGPREDFLTHVIFNGQTVNPNPQSSQLSNVCPIKKQAYVNRSPRHKIKGVTYGNLKCFQREGCNSTSASLLSAQNRQSRMLRNRVLPTLPPTESAQQNWISQAWDMRPIQIPHTQKISIPTDRQRDLFNLQGAKIVIDNSPRPPPEKCVSRPKSAPNLRQTRPAQSSIHEPNDYTAILLKQYGHKGAKTVRGDEPKVW
eukprot:TRINITY_DN1727_c0_g1_i10.p1 TRINITY_DN1727_c0_g1~~TRINITY_DN1727_c0_g1_i10.p1  ORF type:complete len:308 (-),score=36.88 TRINITY_DN1727_c0_g1_i10:865-1788(-)